MMPADQIYTALTAHYDATYAAWRYQEDHLDRLRTTVNAAALSSAVDDGEFDQANRRHDDQAIVVGRLRARLSALAEARQLRLSAATDLAGD